MAEGGFFEGVLGGEADEREEGAPGADPAALALALDEAQRDPALAAKAGAYLDEQRALTHLQIKHFDEERRLAIAAARRKRYADRIRNAFSTLLALGVLLVLIFIGDMVVEAMGDHGLVIDAFSVPADLARDGLTGQVIAQRVLDKLNALQAATQAERPPKSYQNNWGQELKVEIPETGISLGEIQKLLSERLGHAEHVRGEVVRTASGIALTARFGEEPGETVEGPAQDLDALAQKTAEAIYRASQPYRFVSYLLERDRSREAQTAAEAFVRTADAHEQPWAYDMLASVALARGDLAAASRAAKTAIALGGAGGEHAHINAATIALWSGDEEALYKESLLLDEPGYFERTAAEVTPDATASNRLIGSGYLAAQLGDFAKAARDYAKLAETHSRTSSSAFDWGEAAWAMGLAHDPGAAQALAQTEPRDLDFYETEAVYGWYAVPDYQLAAEQGDWAAALADLRRVDASIEAGKGAHPDLALLQPVLVRPLLARALLKTGDLKGAEAEIAPTAMDCYLCLRVRGQIAAAAGDAAGSNRAFAAAVRRAPDIPFAYADWAQAKLQRGDVRSALDLFRTANAKGPRYADALKGWGDALLRAGDRSGALAKYDGALKLAPAWPELNGARAAAAR